MSYEEEKVGHLTGKVSIAAYAGVSSRTIGRWIRRGYLRHRRLSAKLVTCHPHDVDDCMKRIAEEYSQTKLEAGNGFGD